MVSTIENVVFNYSGWPAMLNKSSINKIMKQAFIEIGTYWHKKFLPEHFKLSGAKKYGYTKRKGEGESGKAFWRSYTGQKKKYKGHTQPLVFSGKGRQRALSMLKIVAQKKGGNWQCRVKLPRKFNFRHPKSDVNMREEITAITPNEHTQLARLFQASVIRQINELSGTRTIKI